MSPARRLRPSLAAALLPFLVAGCGASATGPGGARAPFVVKNPFPARAKLGELAMKPAQLSAPETPHTFVPGWRIDPTGVPEQPGAVEARVVATAGPNAALRPSRELRCAARELGRFYAENHAAADERVERHVLALCGVAEGHVGWNVAEVTAPASMRDADLLAPWSPKLPEDARGAEIGGAIVRKGDRATAFVVYGKRKAIVEVSKPDADGTVLVRGTLADTGSIESLYAYVNQGATGVAKCAPDEMPLPHVSFRCPMAKDDAAAWIQILAQPNDRLLSHPVASLIVRREDGPYELAGSNRSPQPVKDAAAMRAAVLEGVNAWRKEAKLRPLALSAEQSDVGDKLAGHYLAAELKSDAKTGDLVALGMLAGYEVKGTIRKGDFFSAFLTGTDDVSRWLDYALEMPLGRSTLLDASARSLAIGGTAEGGFVGAVVSTYSLFEGEDHARDADRVHAAIATARAKRGRKAHARLPVSAQSVAHVTRVHQGADPGEGLDLVLAAESSARQAGVRGWVVATNDLDAIELPKEILEAPSASIGVVTTYTKPAQAAWGMYVTYVYMTEAGGGGGSI